MSTFQRHLAVTLVLVSCAGCGEQADRWKQARPATVPVSGLVKFQGAPLQAAIIVFQPANPGGYGASAVTDDQGHFDLSTFPPDPGAVPGSYAVTVMKTEMPENAGDVPHVVSVIPARYGNPAKSKLTAEVPATGAEGLVFELTK